MGNVPIAAPDTSGKSPEASGAAVKVCGRNLLGTVSKRVAECMVATDKTQVAVTWIPLMWDGWRYIDPYALEAH